MAIDVGDTVPDLTLSDHEGETVSIGDLRGRPALLFFYPRAMTPGCTIEACDFRDRHESLIAAGYQVLGVSPDPPQRNLRFREKEHLSFPLLSDEDHRLASAMGAWGIKHQYGKEYEGIIRSTFLVGPDGRLERAWRNVQAKGHVRRVAEDLGL